MPSRGSTDGRSPSPTAPPTRASAWSTAIAWKPPRGRAAALRVSNLRDALWSAGTYAAAIAIGAAAVRFIEIPRLLGPALLTLTFYLWDAFHGAAPARRRDLGWLWQTLLLVVLGVVVVALNLMTRT